MPEQVPMVVVTKAFSAGSGWTVDRSVQYTRDLAALTAERYRLPLASMAHEVRQPAPDAQTWEVVVVLAVKQ
jgi:hypothetical protein